MEAMTQLERAQLRYEQAQREAVELSRLAELAPKIEAFAGTALAASLWRSWAGERFRLATPHEIAVLAKFATYGVSDSDCYEVTGMTPAGWAKLVEFTDLARKEKRKIPALRSQEKDSEENTKDHLTSSVFLDILEVSGEKVV